jgi:hypothetical protein
MTYYITATNRKGEIMGHTQTDAQEIYEAAVKYYTQQGWLIKTAMGEM